MHQINGMHGNRAPVVTVMTVKGKRVQECIAVDGYSHFRV